MLSVQIQSPRLNAPGNSAVHIGIRKLSTDEQVRRRNVGIVTDSGRCSSHLFSTRLRPENNSMRVMLRPPGRSGQSPAASPANHTVDCAMFRSYRCGTWMGGSRLISAKPKTASPVWAIIRLPLTIRPILIEPLAAPSAAQVSTPRRFM